MAIEVDADVERREVDVVTVLQHDDAVFTSDGPENALDPSPQPPPPPPEKLPKFDPINKPALQK
jgi:hypothetical protein